MININFDKKIICNAEYVGVRIIENCDNLQVGKIFLLENAKANERLAFCKIENIGSVAAEKTGLSEGDYVMIDRLATFAHTAPVAALKYDSVICKTNETQSEYFPLKNMVFVDPDGYEQMTKVNNIYIPGSYEHKLRLGTIVKMNIEPSIEVPYAVGDKVMLTKGPDIVQFNTEKVYIYKYDLIICKIVD